MPLQKDREEEPCVKGAGRKAEIGRITCGREKLPSLCNLPG